VNDQQHQALTWLALQVAAAAFASATQANAHAIKNAELMTKLTETLSQWLTADREAARLVNEAVNLGK